MDTHARRYLMVTGFILLISLAATVQGTSTAISWKDQPPTEGSFTGAMFSSDGNTVFAGGSQMLYRTWDGTTRWGGRAATISQMSADGNYVVYALGKSIVLLDNKGADLWTRNMDNPVRAVAIAPNGSLVVSADNGGVINSWSRWGDDYGKITTDQVKGLAVAPDRTYVVATTENGLQYLDASMHIFWQDNKSGSWDTYIAISSDSSTVITSGGTRLASHTRTGGLNWRKDVTKNAIADMACSNDDSVIILGSQDGAVQAVDQSGLTHWTYPANTWVNGVGVARDGSVIAATALDQYLYVLNIDGQLLTKRKIDTIIRDRSVAVSGDGIRIALDDQNYLYGIALTGGTRVTPEPTFVSTIPGTSPVTTVTTETPPPTTEPITAPSEPVTTSTPKSPLSAVVAIAAILSISLVLRKKNER